MTDYRAGDDTGAEQMAASVIVALVAMLWLAGMTLSFTSVSDAVEPYVGGYAPIVPLGVDIGIAAFTGLDLLMAKMRMRTRWLRLVPWSLVATTVYLNVADETDWLGRVTHGVLPLLAVVVVEAGAHYIRVRAGLSDETQPRERLGLALWLLAPVSTAALYRRMVITDAATPDYVDARIVAARWRDEHGRRWRWRVKREQRVLYRYGRLKPTGVVIEVPATQEIKETAPALNSAPRSSRPPEFAPSADVSDLLPVARQIATDLGRVPGWKVMAAEVRKRDLPCGTPKAQALVAALKAERNGSSDEPT